MADAETTAKDPKVEWKKGLALFRRFWPFARTERRRAIVVGALQVATIPVGVISPLLMKHIFDVSIKNEDLHDLVRMLVIVFGLTLFSHVLRTIAALMTVPMQNRIRHRLVREMFEHVLRLPLRYFHKTETGYVMARIREDVQALDAVMLDRIIDAGIDALRAVVFLVVLLWVDFGLAMSGLALFAVIGSGVLLMSPALRRRSEEAQEEDAKSSAALHQSISGITTVRSAAREAGERGRFGRANRDAIRSLVRLSFLHVGVGYTIGLAMALGLYLILGVGALRMALGVSTSGSIISFMLYLTYVMGAVTSLMQLNPQVQRAFASLQRIYRLLDEPAEGAIEPVVKIGRLAGRVELDHVSFRYEEDIHALTDVDLRVEPGEVVALVGRSGAGKSTLVHLIPRLFDPTSGVVRIDGSDVRHLQLDALRRQIGVVPQDVFLFNRTIRENISYAVPQAEEAAIRAAARAAHAETFIGRLPKGYDTLVGERGVKLSGGEKQRIAIAREILRNPPILILDEATSSLDSESEALIQDALDGLKRNRTCFIIAHRLSTVLGADRIVVLDGGRILEQGTHVELLARNGLYRKLHDTQFRIDENGAS